MSERGRCDEAPPPGVLKGIEEFNAREFFECHESIEAEWIPEKDPIRLMWQGILQVGVAFYHVQRGRWKSAVTMLERGIPKLEPFAPRCQGVDVEALIEDAKTAEARLRELGPERLQEFDPALFPTIRVGRVER